jgi:hypothetical protein
MQNYKAAGPRIRRRGLARVSRLLIPLACVVGALAFVLIGNAPTARSGAPPARSGASLADSGAPPIIAGIWHHEFPGHVNQHIAFHGSQFLVYVERSDTATMSTRFHGNHVTFYDSNTCPGSGTYRWSVKHGALRFKLLGSDPCHRAQLLPHIRWTRP